MLLFCTSGASPIEQPLTVSSRFADVRDRTARYGQRCALSWSCLGTIVTDVLTSGKYAVRQWMLRSAKIHDAGKFTKSDGGQIFSLKDTSEIGHYCDTISIMRRSFAANHGNIYVATISKQHKRWFKSRVFPPTCNPPKVWWCLRWSGIYENANFLSNANSTQIFAKTKAFVEFLRLFV